jgi:transporter family-2 protein
MSHWYLVPVALLIGVLTPVQAGVNARLSAAVGSQVSAGLLTVVVALAAMALFATASRTPVPSAGQLAAAPWWAWLGGVIGAGYVVASIYLAPRLGAAALTGFVVTGMLFGAVVLDHFGVVGFDRRPATATRLLGLVLLVGGAYLVNKS